MTPISFEEVESLLACADASLSNPAARPELAKLWDHIAGHRDTDSQALSDAAADDSGIASAATGMTSALPSNIGPYRILRLLGEGGMGVVYEAEQEHPRRTVALKVIKSGLSDPKLIRRFEQELLALGRLQHPGIAQIYEAGTADNRIRTTTVFRHGTHPRSAAARVRRRASTDNTPAAGVSSPASARPFTTLINAASSTATSNPAIFSWMKPVSPRFSISVWREQPIATPE